MAEKKALRKQMKQRRNALTVKERNEAGRQAAKEFLQLSEVKNCQTVFIYLSYGSELPTLELITELLKINKEVAVPKVQGAGEMDFYRIYSLEECIPGAFGILEPREGKILYPAPKGSGQTADVLVLPGLAFTLSGDRLGYGGGYYDRYLQQYPNTFTAAFAYECSIVSKLPAQSHDKKADVLILPGQAIRL